MPLSYNIGEQSPMSLPFKIRVISTLYRSILKPILFKRDPENVHDTMMRIGSTLGHHRITQFITHTLFFFEHPVLEQTVAGIHFRNPIGLAAGFDKNAQLTNILPDVGFGFEEIGSVTGEPCSGNARPRLWRLPEEKSLRVYYGLKNDGAENIAKRLRLSRLHEEGAGGWSVPIGISIAKTNCAATAETPAAIVDYVKAYLAFEEIGDYVTINISCPNAFGGQPFTDAARLDQLLSAIDAVRDVRPIFLKLSPDLSETELHALAEVALAHHVDGLITSNLTKQHAHGDGGLSGKAVEAQSIAHLTYLRKTFGNKFILIACGGVFSAEDAYKRIRLGASLIQLITGMIFEGPQLIGEINRGLVELLKRDGFEFITDIIGIDVK
ncbi:MAG: quinone-dependent dihydroorotate dehydrogenase [Candidatus Uhrbacteria bacterium]|nr:quinone-dependent dihydroorotate dehydrogenase [Candidatus Uhrbacteria bacterium]